MFKNFEIEKKIVLEYNTNFTSRYASINSLTNKRDQYLEIGVEYGTTFQNVHFEQKVGVDPDPKFEVENKASLKIMTSDDFFKDNETFFDVVFIDGMHQSEYVVNDFNNSIVFLKENGKIFIDDILPISPGEQLKIPGKHYYEKGILKYGEPWTGDVWKVMFYILKYHINDIEFIYFNHNNYRGVGMIKIIKKFFINLEKMEEINSYDYYADFNDYLKYFQ